MKKNRAKIELAWKTEPDNSQPDPDRPDDFEFDPGARSPQLENRVSPIGLFITIWEFLISKTV